MEKYVVRLLDADEIECRAATVNEKGISILLYKDARVDQKILDETFGVFGWQRNHQSIEGCLYCTVSVYDRETQTWISKQDVGAAGFAEKEKSQASDSFKRACFNWGIGRELYTAPFIWIPANKVKIEKRGDRYLCADHFSVSSITYSEDREITGLEITSDKNGVVYRMGEKDDRKQKKASAPISSAQVTSLKEELKRTGVTMEAVQERYQIQKPESMSEELYGRVMAALSKTKSAA